MMAPTGSSLIVLVAASGPARRTRSPAAARSSRLPALMFTGMDARAANITSTVALFPAQIVMGFTGRDDMAAPPGLSVRALFVISLAGGALGALILLATPPSFFARLVPWLVLFATAMFAWGSFFRKPRAAGEASPAALGAGLVQFGIAIYGGYFGGGIGLLMMAALTMAGLARARRRRDQERARRRDERFRRGDVRLFARRALDAGDHHRGRGLARRLSRRPDAEAGQREGAAHRACHRSASR